MENEENNFDKNFKEIREMSLKLKEPLEEPITILYFDYDKKTIKYKGGYENDKYDGRGILYDYYEGKIYSGYFKNNEYDGFGNEYKYKRLLYEGFYEEGKRNGKGMLYYYNSDKIFFNGIFDKNNFIEGIMYDPSGNKLYEGNFMNNKPKEAKNIKLYKLNGELEYEGDILNGQFHGQGTLYEIGKYEKEGIYSEFKYLKYVGEFKNDFFNGKGKLYVDNYLGKYLFYEGNFDNNNFSDIGKIYYQNKNIFYDGQFLHNKMNGKGIKYYKNGNIKIKGTFSSNICLEGEYYNPSGNKIYDGEFKNDIPKESKNIIIYDNNTNKIYEGEIHNGNYEGKGIEYCPLMKDKILFKGEFKNNLFIIPDFEIKEFEGQSFKIASKITLLSYGDVPGKTCLINGLMGNEFREEGLATIGTDKSEIFFENNKKNYKLIFWDTAGAERFRAISLKTSKTSNIVIYLFNLNDDKGVNPYFIDEIKENKEDILIYVVGNKLDEVYKEEKIDIINQEYFGRFRNVVAELINKNLVYKYFEISVKTKEGLDNLLNNLKMDSMIYLKSFNENPDNIRKKDKKKYKKRDKCIIN